MQQSVARFFFEVVFEAFRNFNCALLFEAQSHSPVDTPWRWGHGGAKDDTAATDAVKPGSETHSSSWRADGAVASPVPVQAPVETDSSAPKATWGLGWVALFSSAVSLFGVSIDLPWECERIQHQTSEAKWLMGIRR